MPPVKNDELKDKPSKIPQQTPLKIALRPGFAFLLPISLLPLLFNLKRNTVEYKV